MSRYSAGGTFGERVSAERSTELTPKSQRRSLSRGVEPGSETERPRTAPSFCVPKAEIATNGYDLSLNRYKQVVHEAVDHLPPQEILATLAELETKIQQGMQELAEMLGNEAK